MILNNLIRIKSNEILYYRYYNFYFNICVKGNNFSLQMDLDFFIFFVMDVWKFDMYIVEQLFILYLKILYCVFFNLMYLFILLDLFFYVNLKVQFLFDFLIILKFMLNEIKSIVCIYIYIKCKKNIWRRWRVYEFNFFWNY